jgi:hypothetical protein
MDPARSRVVVLLLAGLLAQAGVFVSATIFNQPEEDIKPLPTDKSAVVCEIGPEASISCGPGLVVQVRETFYGAWSDSLSKQCGYDVGYNSTCRRSGITAVDLACNGKNVCPIPTDKTILPKPPSAMVVFTGADMCVGFAKYLMITYDCRGQQPPPMLSPPKASTDTKKNSQSPSTTSPVTPSPTSPVAPGPNSDGSIPTAVRDNGNAQTSPPGMHKGSPLNQTNATFYALVIPDPRTHAKHAQTEARSTRTYAAFAEPALVHCLESTSWQQSFQPLACTKRSLMYALGYP